MGRLALGIIDRHDDLALHAALDSSSNLDAMLGADVVFDVTHPSASGEIVDFAVARSLSIVVGTSGWSSERIDTVRQLVAGRDDAAPVFFVPNFSLGSVLGTLMATIAAPFFDSIEILEAHHAGKVDSPSGTAVRTAELIDAVRGEAGPVSAPHADQRARGQLVAGVPVHSLRLSGMLAEQRVLLGGQGETLTVTHTTLSPESYVAGILRALREVRSLDGVVVGLEQLLDIRLPSST